MELREMKTNSQELVDLNTPIVMPSILYAAIYKPLDGTVKHWSIWLTGMEFDTDMLTVYKVVGKPILFCHNMPHGKHPNSIAYLVCLIDKCEFDSAETVNAKEKLDNQEICNNMAQWS
ncbi:hypothetical protein RUND412_004802 [Rhizina undulata]